jgi:PDZ domain-containing protein
MRLVLARNRLIAYAAAAVLAAVAAFVPTPYSLMLPGQAVDLTNVVAVNGHRAPAGSLFLTDVRFAARATTVQLLSSVMPGAQIVRTQDYLPQDTTAVEYEGVQREAMSESQSIAAFVAERAAGYRVPVPQSRVLVVMFSKTSRAKGVLRPLDMLVSIDGHPIASNIDVERALAHVKSGASVRMALFRRGEERTLTVPTIAYKTRTALGAYLTTIYQRPQIPVGVAFHLPNVEGSSAGLMFALQIYRTLHPLREHAHLRVAGTGTIAYDGSVGPIEGARQKVVAAKAAGATLFFVPKENYSEIAGTNGIRIVPVTTFTQALQSMSLPAVSQVR